MKWASVALSHIWPIFSAGKDVRPICMHHELSPQISTNDSITSLQASRIMSCGITVSPSGNHLPGHRPRRARVAAIAAAAAQQQQQSFTRGKKCFPPPQRRPFTSPAEGKTKTAVLTKKTFLPLQEPSQLSWKLRSLSLWQRSGWQNKFYEETRRSNLDLTAETGHMYLMDFIR